MSDYHIERIDAKLPFAVHLKLVAYAFSITYLADQLVDRLLNKQPIASILRELIVDLSEFENHTMAGEKLKNVADLISCDLRESTFQKAAIHDDKLLLWDEYSIEEFPWQKQSMGGTA